MNCKVCGSAEFVTNDGITYCTECQLQVEETQTEVAVEPTLSRDIGSSGPKKTPIQKKQVEYSDWITIECFNHILYMQISSLIKLGASPKLKSTVLYIWSKYLQKCESAFRVDYQAKDVIPHLGSKPFKRDLNILYGKKKKLKCKRKKAVESHSESSENLSAEEELSAVDSNSGTDTYTDTSIVSEDKRSRPKYSVHARKMLRKKKLTPRIALQKVFNMTLAKTLSICYLGLLYTEDQLSLTDLIRFVYEEKIPYVNLLNKLPPTMKLEMGSDRLTFLTNAVPNAYCILKVSREIMHFIKLPEYKEQSIHFAAARLVRDLNLPSDFLSIIKKLIELYKGQLSKYVNPPKIENIPTDYQALAFILIAMKMLFVLDDKFEIEHSNVMKKLNALHPDRRYFNWKEWKEHSMVKEFLFLLDKPVCSATNNLDSLSANAIISKYPFMCLKPSSEGSQNPRDVAPAKHKIIKVLSDMVHIPSSNPHMPTSFPLRRAVKCFMEQWKTLPMFKETKEIDFTLLQNDFSSDSLSFNPLQFDKVEDELSHLLMTSLYLPDTSVNLGSKYYSPVTHHHKVIYTTSSYWFLNWPESNYETSDITSVWLDKLPNSFKWLLNFFSKYAYCSNIALYKEVARTEKILFLQRRQIKQNVNFKNKINVDF